MNLVAEILKSENISNDLESLVDMFVDELESNYTGANKAALKTGAMLGAISVLTQMISSSKESLNTYIAKSSKENDTFELEMIVNHLNY